MTYCISDTHGDFDRYQEMLRLIDFSDEDTLYFLGDAIDRGPKGVDILLDVMNRKNVVFMLGNHEQMCLDDLLRHEWNARSRWQMNGGGVTRSDLIYKRSQIVRASVLRFLLRAPTALTIDVKGQTFHLVHGFPAENDHDRLWNRPETNSPPPIEGAIVIVGHTPTPLLTDDYDSPFSIWHGSGLIDIDCGCASRSPMRRLGCLRLDDMAEFYV